MSRSKEVLETYSFLKNEMTWHQELFTSFVSTEFTRVQPVGLQSSPHNNKTCSAGENTEIKKLQC